MFLDIKPLCSNLTITINVRVAGPGRGGSGQFSCLLTAGRHAAAPKRHSDVFLAAEVDSLDRAAVTREPPAREVKLRGHSLY